MSRVRALRARTHIVLWTIACILPMLGGALFATWRLADSEREAERTQIVQNAHVLSAAVDLKLEKSVAALEALGTSPALTAGRLAEFYDQCAAVARQHDAWVMLVDADGQTLINTLQPFGTALPHLRTTERMKRALEERRHQISGVFRGRTLDHLQVALYAPVFRGDGSRFVLIMGLKIEDISQILTAQNLPGSWTATVSDQSGMIVGRNHALDRFAGKPIGELLQARMRTATEGSYVGTNREGIRVFAAFATSPVTGWSIILGIPLAEIDAPLVRSLAMTVIITLLMLTIAIVAAAVKGRQIAGWLDNVSRAAMRVANGESPIPAQSSIAEVNEVTASLQTAAALVDRKSKERDAAEALLSDWVAAANDWFWETDAGLRYTFLSDGFTAATGIEAASLIGRHPADAGHGGPDRATWDAHLDELAARRPFRDFLVTGQKGDGRPYYVSISGRPYFDDAGRFLGYRGTGRDVTAQIQAEREVARQTETLSVLVQNLPLAVSLVGADLRFRAFNNLFLEGVGLTPDMLKVGDPYEKFIRLLAARGEYGPGNVEALVRIRLTRVLLSRPEKFDHTSTDGRVLDIRLTPLPGGGFVTTRTDITDRRRRELEMEQERQRLERHAVELTAARLEAESARSAADAANAAKSLFLANMSHELRTPLNAILGFSEMIASGRIGPLDSRYQQYGRDVNVSGQHLLRLINDLLDQSRIEIGQLELQEELFAVDEVVEECRRLLAAKADDGGIALTAALAATLPRLHADRVRIKQILLNLMSNAVKFTPPGGWVRVTAAPTEDGGLAIVVADSGIGMRAEDIPAALEPFRQIENSLARRYEGAGLGLSLTKALTELHGGRFEIDSEVGKGTVATVWLPPARLKSAAREATQDAD